MSEVERIRFIPAWAGNTPFISPCMVSATVHPRVGGEHIRDWKLLMIFSGSSPRGRGTHHRLSDHARALRFIPAWAGNTSAPTNRVSSSAVHPRVGGEHPGGYHGMGKRAGSSPRGRGTRVSPPNPARLARFIPAWAGNTQRHPAKEKPHPVHPRVGGEHAATGDVAFFVAGSSPRGRGTLSDIQPKKNRIRFIPAWAGNTWEEVATPAFV